MMPALTAAQIQSLRTHPHRLGDAQYLYVFVPDVVFAAQVNGNVGRVQTIPYHNVTQGAFGNVFRGMTLWVGSSAGARDKGFVRMRTAADAANLYASEHEIDLEDGDHLTVLDEYRLWHVDPYIHTDGTIYKDWNGVAPGGLIAFPVGWENIYQPVPVMGPHSVEFIDPTTGLASHCWDWSSSWPVNPLASDWVTYAAVFAGGVPAASGAATGTVTWDTAGHRWAHLAVRDTRGIVSYTSRRLYVTLDRSNLPSNCYVDFVPSPRIGTVAGGGFSVQFTVHIDVPESAFPDHALVIWFFDGGTQEDISGNWPCRSHIHFIGYIRKASTHKEPETGYVTFEATTIEGVMRSLPMFPNFYEDVAAGDCNVWTEAVALTVQRAAYLHMRWQTSLLEMADVIFVPDADTPIGEHEFPEGFLYNQLDALVNRDYMYRIGCDPLSTIYFNKDPQFLTTQPATIMDVQAQDWREELDFPEPLEYQTSYVIASGNAYSGGTVSPLFSEAPGPVPLQLGKRDKSLSRLICTTQGALNTLSGLVLAADNNDFPDIPIKLDGQYYIGHLFPMELIGLDIDSADTKRQMDLSSDLFIPRRSSLQVVYDPEAAVSHALVDVNVEKLTTGEGVAGQTLTYPTGPPGPPGPDEGPDGGDWEPPRPTPPDPPVGDGNLLYFVDGTNGHVYRTRNARASNPADVVYEDLGQVDAGGLVYITLDSFNPKNRAMVCGNGGVWRTTNLNDAIPTWTMVLDGTPSAPVAYNHDYKMIASSICQQNRWMVTSRFYNPDQLDWFCWVFWSDNGGNTWSNQGLDYWGNPCGIRPVIEMSSHDADRAWVTWLRSGIDHTSKTTDCWTSWSGHTLPGMAAAQRPCSYHRYLDNDNDLYALWGGKSGIGALEAQVNWCTADHATCGYHVLSAGVTGDTWWVGGYTWGTNRYWALIVAAGNCEFHVSDDGSTWALQYTFPGSSEFISGWPYDGERFYATQNPSVGPPQMGPILISDDRGVTWQDQTGNWGTLVGWSGDIDCCVPVWVV